MSRFSPVSSIYIDLETDYIDLDPDTNCGCDGLHEDLQFCDMVL